MLGRYVSPDYQMMERGRASKSILLQDFRINQTKNKQRRVNHSVLFSGYALSLSLCLTALRRFF